MLYNNCIVMARRWVSRDVWMLSQSSKSPLVGHSRELKSIQLQFQGNTENPNHVPLKARRGRSSHECVTTIRRFSGKKKATKQIMVTVIEALWGHIINTIIFYMLLFYCAIRDCSLWSVWPVTTKGLFTRESDVRWHHASRFVTAASQTGADLVSSIYS